MSSSRSIAAARNRRAGGNEQPVQRSRPNTSIASQPAFSQQQQQIPQRVGNVRVPQQQPQQQFEQQSSNQLIPVNKISISDAIGLITIRLGRVEQYMQQLQEDGNVTGASNTLSEKVQFVEKDVIFNLTDRIYTLENNPENNNLSNKISLLEKEVKEIRELEKEVKELKKEVKEIRELEKEVKEIRELLNDHINKFATFMSETEQKFLDVDAAFVEFEKNLQIDTNEPIEPIQTDDNQVTNEEDDEDEEEVEKPAGPTFSSVNLKTIISKELANAEISL